MIKTNGDRMRAPYTNLRVPVTLLTLLESPKTARQVTEALGTCNTGATETYDSKWQRRTLICRKKSKRNT